jgi:hypothetical protein
MKKTIPSGKRHRAAKEVMHLLQVLDVLLLTPGCLGLGIGLHILGKVVLGRLRE